jgi:phospholipid/cholesterol/gamma-HCH transport system substrate-binding protein
MPGTRNPVATAIVGLLAVVLVVVLAFNGPAIFSPGTTYRAEFSEAAGLTSGDMVTVAGVEAVADIVVAAGRPGRLELI